MLGAICQISWVPNELNIIHHNQLHAPLGPTHPSKCCLSPDKHIHLFPIFNFICQRYRGFTLLPSASCHHLIHAHTRHRHTNMPMHTRAHIQVHTESPSKWLTHAYLICHSSKHMCTHTHTRTFLTVSDKRGNTKPFFIVAIKEEEK